MATTKTEITATAIYKITIKETGKVCYAVPSDSSDKMYTTCFDEATSGWTCTCAHGTHQAQRGRDAHCKHVAAAQTSIKANKPLETSQKGSLHGSQGFSLMR